jgi:shikimate kinase
VRIVLTGFMGSGKSVVGRRLAERLGLSFLDLDEIIEGAAGMSIREIFATEGEPGFRRRERELIAALADRSDCVIATGGGAVLDPENVRTLKRRGVLVWLQADPDVIVQRIGGDARRPLLETADRAGRVQALLGERAAAYAQADLAVQAGDATVEDVVDRIVRDLPPGPAASAGATG